MLFSYVAVNLCNINLLSPFFLRSFVSLFICFPFCLTFVYFYISVFFSFFLLFLFILSYFCFPFFQQFINFCTYFAGFRTSFLPIYDQNAPSYMNSESLIRNKTCLNRKNYKYRTLSVIGSRIFYFRVEQFQTFAFDLHHFSGCVFGTEGIFQ